MAQPDVYNFEISDSNFNQIVIENSNKLPVFVLFMSPTIPACVSLESVLIDYAHKFAGEFILARFDIDMYPEARERFGITNIPTLQVFHHGVKQTEEVGTLTYEFLDELFKIYGIVDESEDLRKAGLEKHKNGETAEAIQLMTEAIQKNPSNVQVAMDMCQIFLDINMLEQAASLFTRLPDNIKEEETPRYLIGQITFKKLALDMAGIDVLTEAVEKDPNNFDNKFDLAVCLMAAQQYEAGMKHLVEMLQQDANAKDGAVQEMAIVTVNLLEHKQPELSANLRRQMSNAIAV